MKKVIILLLGALLLLTGIACSSDESAPPTTAPSESTSTGTTETAPSESASNDNTPSANSQQTETKPKEQQPPKKEPASPQTPSTQNNGNTANAKKNPIVTIEMADGGKIKIELYPKVAPDTVNNFISLVQKGFYNGLIFHRVIPGFMIQGGDPQGIGMGGPGYSIKGEFAANGFPNKLKHERGVLSMARSGMPDSAGSQFFIMVKEAPHLDGNYAAFGKVLEGMEVADKIVNTPKGENDKPLQEQKMNKVTVETFGVRYEEPVKLSE